jgi:hypothetical protein
MQPVLLTEKYKRFKHWYKNQLGYDNTLLQIWRWVQVLWFTECPVKVHEGTGITVKCKSFSFSGMTLRKVKAIPVHASTENRHLKLVGLSAKRTGHLHPTRYPWYSSIERLSRPQGHSTAERFKDNEKSL